MNPDLIEAAKIVGGILAALGITGTGSWVGSRRAMNGLEKRMVEGFKDVRGDVARVEGKVDLQNGRIRKNEVGIGRLEERTRYLRPGNPQPE